MKTEDYRILSERVDNGLRERHGLPRPLGAFIGMPFLLFLDYVFNFRLMHGREAIHP